MLNLNFRYCVEVTSKSVIHLAHVLESLNFLNELYVNFSACNKLDDTIIEPLKKTLANLVSLKEMKVLFDEC